MNMNKTEFLKEVQVEGDFSSLKEAEKAYNAFVGAIYKSLKNSGKIILAGFGTFELKTKPAGTVKNPKTGALIKTDAKSVPKFKFSSSFKTLLA